MLALIIAARNTIHSQVVIDVSIQQKTCLITQEPLVSLSLSLWRYSYVYFHMFAQFNIIINILN